MKLSIWCVKAFFVAMLIFLGVVLLVPFRPLMIHTMQTIPLRACPEKPVIVMQDREVDRKPWTTMDEVESFSDWSGVAGTAKGRTEEGGYAKLEKKELDRLINGREWTRGIVQRTAPKNPGTWRLNTTYVVKGTSLLLPKHSEFRAISQNTIEVLPEEHPDCRG
jgi:hypothetical protein